MIRQTGSLVLVQDGGRVGWAHVGVPPSGALDFESLALANRLVGNDDDAAGLEVLLGGLTFVPDQTLRVAVTGAVATVAVSGRPARWGSPLSVLAGDEVAIGHASVGLRVYVAIGGGIAVAPVLGSRSTDTLTGLGPEPVRAGDHLPIAGRYPTSDVLRDPVIDEVPSRAQRETVDIHVEKGPRVDWFRRPATALHSGEYAVSTDSDRVAVRLVGRALKRRKDRPTELESEGLVTGAVQVPSDGCPLVFLNDHPVTGGYPVVGVVSPGDLPALAQVRPGDRVRLHPTWLDPSERRRLRRSREARIEG